MDANPHVNCGRVLKALDLPDFAQYALSTPGPGEVVAEAPRKLGELLGGWPWQHRTVPGARRQREEPNDDEWMDWRRDVDLDRDRRTGGGPVHRRN
jgi:hypothetical protein